MIITLTGDNTYMAAQAERQLIDAFTAKHGPNGIERVDGEELTTTRLPDLLQGATLFAPVRLVIIKNIASNKALHEPLADALASAAAETTVVIADSNLDKRTKLYKFLKTKSDFKDFGMVDEQKLATWAQQIAKAAGAEIAKADALYLVQRAGTDQWRLHNEIEKLASYQPQITRSTIDELVEANPQADAFALLEATFAADNKKLVQLLGALKTGEDAYKFFGLLASQTHALAVIAAAGTRPADQIAKSAGLHPFVVRKTQPLASKLGAAKVARIANVVADCDWQLKSTGADPWQLIEVTLQKIAAI